MANEAGKLYAARQAHINAQKGTGAAPTDELALAEKNHQRGYNPIDEAKRGNVSQTLNADAAKYKQGPGPV